MIDEKQNPIQRDLWSEIDAAKIKQSRERAEKIGAVLYYIAIGLGFLVSVMLYTRPHQILLQVFGVCSAIILTASDLAWLNAVKHGAKGKQRNIARLFWAAGFAIYALNIAALYYFEMGVEMGDIIGRWYYNASMLTIVIMALGWALFVMASISQRSVDAFIDAESDALALWEHGIKHPSQVVKEKANLHINEAYSRFIDGMAQSVAASMGGLIPHSKNGKVPEPATRSLNTDVADPNASAPTRQ